MSISPPIAAASRHWQFGLPLLFALVTCLAAALGLARFYGANALETSLVLTGTVMYVVLLVMPGVAFASLGVRYGRPVAWGAAGGGAMAASYVAMLELRGENHTLLAYAAMATIGAVVGVLCGIAVRRRARDAAAAVGWGVARDLRWRQGRTLLPVLSAVWVACLHVVVLSSLPDTRQYRSWVHAASLEVYGWSLVAAPSLVGIGALWAWRQRLFAVRLALVAAAIALALPLRPGDLTLVFGVQALIVAAAIRLVRRPADAAPSADASPLSTTLLGEVLPLAAATCLLGSAAAPLVQSRPALAGTAALVGACWAVVTLAAAWAILGRGRFWSRMLVAGIAVAWAGDLMVVLTSNPEGPFPRFEIGGGDFANEYLGWWWLAAAAAVAGTIALWLGLWRLARRSPPAHGPAPKFAAPRRWTLARLTAGCAALAMPFALAVPPALLYWRLVFWPTVVAAPLPQPNGFDDLIRADEAIANSIPAREQTPNVGAVWAARYATEMRSAREALARQSRVPLGSPAFPSRLVVLFVHAGDAAASEGRYADAAQCYLDALRTAHAGARGGGLDHVSAEAQCGNVAAGNLSLLAQHLSEAQLQEVVAAVQALEADREPLSAYSRRTREAELQVADWRGRLQVLLDDRRLRGAWRVPHARAHVLRRDAAMGLLQTECAIAAFRLRHGRLPAGLAELVPEILPRVPGDPYGGPLVYKPAGDEYLLYSVGADLMDDGGTRAASESNSGDLDAEFFAEPGPSWP